MSFAYQFWKRVDERLEEMKIDLKTLSSETNLSYWSVLGWRSKDRTPGAEELVAISKALNLSLDVLLAGESPQVLLCPEAKVVNEDPELQALVRAIMKDRRLLSALASVITSMENTSAGLA